ncbi:MAG TPA: hypothetical protein VK348_06840, partial [Planctomycetota bacterium]|nr:hypothetical protein [Planctomycetota bacterium]
RFLPLLLRLCVGIVAMRLPIALLSKLASDRQLGTSLDIHTITVFLVPVTHQEMEVLPGSLEQQQWLVWAPHVLFFPAFYLMSLGGVAFAAFLFHRHPPGPD